MPNPTGTINADEDHSGKTITNVPDPSAAQDVATKAYADSISAGGVNAFGTIVVAGQSNVVADAAPDTLTLAAGSNVTLTTNAGTDTVTIAASGGSGTVTTTGSPTSGKLTKFSGATSITNGDLTGDVTTSGGVATTLAAGNAGNLNSGTLLAARMPALTGDITTSAGAVATTIANDAVTYAKMQNVSAASKLLGRGSASGSGDAEEITLGTNLSMSGTTLNATGGGGGTIASTTDILKGDNAGNAVALGSATSGKVLKSNGTTFVASTETYAAPGTTGNVLTSDGTNWTSAAPAVGGGVTSKVASSDFTTSSLTLVDITGLTFAAAATKLYEIDILLLVQSTTTAGNRYAVNYSAAGSEVTALAWGHQAVQSTAIISESWNSLNTTTSGYSTTANSYGVVRIRGFFRTGANTGNFTVKTAKVTSGTSTVYIGSRMTVTEL